jgi:ParB family transcriptional regulator, chromosome partitioning protein
VPSDDRRAVFVGAKAYQDPGGTIIRELFDAEGGGFFADAELLNRLAREKLQSHADKVAAEGWRWVVAEPELDHEAAAEMRRVFEKPVPLSKKERKRLRKLQARIKALYDKYPEDGGMSAADADKLERIEAAIATLCKEEYTVRDMALAGAFVTLAQDGAVRIERGFVRAEDEPKSKAKAQEPKGKIAKDADGLAPESEKLVAELTAYRTSALRNELANHPATAFLALVHALTLDTFFTGIEASCLEIALTRRSLSGFAEGIAECLAERQSAERHTAWGRRLPKEPEALWTFIHGLSDSERMALLAHCVSLTANATILAREVGLDMAVYWQPTAAGYFGRVSKERILQAVREAASDKEAQKVAGLKKQAMAEAAAAALAGKNWLPAVLRAPDKAAA